MEGGINTYAYVDGNPINFTDRFGLFNDQVKLNAMLAEAAGTRASVQVATKLNPWTAAASLTLPTMMGNGENPYVEPSRKPSRSPEDEKQAQAEHDLYKMNCMHKPFHLDKCTQLKMEITRAQLCWQGMSQWDAKWDPAQKRHSVDIAVWQGVLKKLMDQYERECKKECEVK